MKNKNAFLIESDFLKYWETSNKYRLLTALKQNAKST